jgi:hypothetical protein
MAALLDGAVSDLASGDFLVLPALGVDTERSTDLGFAGDLVGDQWWQCSF